MRFDVVKKEKWRIIYLWLRHLFIFYPLCAVFDNLIDRDLYTLRTVDTKEVFDMIRWSPPSGFLGSYERFPFFFIIMLIVFFGVLFFTRKVFLSYTLSLIICYTLLCFVGVTKDNIFVYLVPSLIITVAINFIVDKKYTKKKIPSSPLIK